MCPLHLFFSLLLTLSHVSSHNRAFVSTLCKHKTKHKRYNAPIHNRWTNRHTVNRSILLTSLSARYPFSYGTRKLFAERCRCQDWYEKITSIWQDYPVMNSISPRRSSQSSKYRVISECRRDVSGKPVRFRFLLSYSVVPVTPRSAPTRVVQTFPAYMGPTQDSIWGHGSRLRPAMAVVSVAFPIQWHECHPSSHSTRHTFLKTVVVEPAGLCVMNT